MDICGIISASSGPRAGNRGRAREEKSSHFERFLFHWDHIVRHQKQPENGEKGILFDFFGSFSPQTMPKQADFWGISLQTAMLYSSFIVCLAYLWKYNHDTKNMLKSSPLPYCNPDFFNRFQFAVVIPGMFPWARFSPEKGTHHAQRIKAAQDGKNFTKEWTIYKSVWRIPYVRERANLIYISAGHFSLQSIALSRRPMRNRFNTRIRSARVRRFFASLLGPLFQWSKTLLTDFPSELPLRPTNELFPFCLPLPSFCLVRNVKTGLFSSWMAPEWTFFEKMYGLSLIFSKWMLD